MIYKFYMPELNETLIVEFEENHDISKLKEDIESFYFDYMHPEEADAEAAEEIETTTPGRWIIDHLCDYEYSVSEWRSVRGNSTVNTSFIKTEILFSDDGKEFDLGSIRKRVGYLQTLSKEEALNLFDAGKRVYFIYENERIYKKNCRKVCKDRDYLIDHYDCYHEMCGVLVDCVELCTFPVVDEDYCLSFVVPKKWCSDYLRKIEYIPCRKKTDNLKEFLDTYAWDETYFIYEAAREEGVILEENNVK